jgi:hypothetical protein
VVRDSFKRAVEDDDLGWSSPACVEFIGCLIRKDQAGAGSIAKFEMPNATNEEVDFFIAHWTDKYAASTMDVVLLDKAELVKELADPDSPKWKSKFLVRTGKFVGISYPIRGEPIKFSMRTHCENDDYGMECLDEIREIVFK